MASIRYTEFRRKAFVLQEIIFKKGEWSPLFSNDPETLEFFLVISTRFERTKETFCLRTRIVVGFEQYLLLVCPDAPHSYKLSLACCSLLAPVHVSRPLSALGTGFNSICAIPNS